MDKQYFLNKLQLNKQTNFKLYNYNFLPKTFLANDKITIECYKHGVFYQKAGNHLFGRGCPECEKLKIGNDRALTTDEFINKSISKFGNKFDYSKTNYFRKNMDITIICPTHGTIILIPDQHIWSKHGCPKCDFEIPRIISKFKTLEKANRIHNNKYDYSNVIYVNQNSKVEIICPIHGSFWQTLGSHTVSRAGCLKCSREADKLSLIDFINKSKEVHGDNYDYSKIQYLNNSSMVTIVCYKHGEFTQRAASHLAGCACKKCFIEKNKDSTEEFLNKAKEVHGNSYDYSKVKYHNSKTKVEIICPTHGSFWQKPNNHISSKAGCSFCMESKGERILELYLKKYNIEYIREYRVLPHLYRFDFYLPEFNIYIEFHGQQHYRPVDIFGGEIAFLKQKKNDEIKKLLVTKQKGFLIEINYFHLKTNSIEKSLILSLKNAYKYWFKIDGKIRVVKTLLDLYREFNIPLSNKNPITDIKRKTNDFHILF